jgi:hypothetical protein
MYHAQYLSEDAWEVEDHGTLAYNALFQHEFKI